eukprot:SAG31_NODE_187_length_20848_cov_22.521953_5_plen_165_part_00
MQVQHRLFVTCAPKAGVPASDYGVLEAGHAYLVDRAVESEQTGVRSLRLTGSNALHQVLPAMDAAQDAPESDLHHPHASRRFSPSHAHPPRVRQTTRPKASSSVWVHWTEFQQDFGVVGVCDPYSIVDAQTFATTNTVHFDVLDADWCVEILPAQCSLTLLNAP